VGLYGLGTTAQIPNVPDQSNMAHKIQLGETIAYSHNFLDRQNQTMNNMELAQGKVIALHRLHTGIVLADIEWNLPGLPKRVNVKNLISMETTALAE
jgi:hypothetical protein